MSHPFLLDFELRKGLMGLFLILRNFKSKNVCSFIDRFLTSEGGGTFISPFTSKTGQSVAQYRQKIVFILPFTSKTGQSVAQYRQKIVFILTLLLKEGHIWHFINLLLDSGLKGTRDRTKCLPFLIDFYPCIPATHSQHPRFSLENWNSGNNWKIEWQR